MIGEAVMERNEAAAESDLERLRRRDVHAAGAVIARYQHRLFRYLMKLVGDTATAEDLFQQTWLKVFEKASSYDPSRSFDGWLFTIAHNVVIDHYRRRSPRSLDQAGRDDDAKPLAVSPDAFELLLERERSSLVATTLKGLPMAYREVLALRFQEDMKLEEIARVLSIPLPTVKSRLHRALENLRVRLQGRIEEARPQ
jgi:RNA polymerase sigma-70 factor (ECF subfamily)